MSPVLVVGLGDEHGCERYPALPFLALLQIGREHVHELSLQVLQVLSVEVEYRAGEPQRAPHVHTVVVEEPLEVIRESAEEHRERRAQLYCIHRLQLAVAHVRQSITECECALDGTADMSFLDDSQDVGLEQRRDVPIQGGLLDLGQRFTQLSRGHTASPELLNDLHAHRMEDDVSDLLLFSHECSPNHSHHDNVLITTTTIEAEVSAMTQVSYGPEGVDIRFPGWEATMAGRGFLRVSISALLSARVEPGWTSEILGMRSGLVVSGYRKLGTFTHPSGARRLVSMKRGLPLLRLSTVRGETGFDEILLSTEDAHRIAQAIYGSLAR